MSGTGIHPSQQQVPGGERPAREAAGFPPIDAYAFLSDTHTGALLGPDGAVEWFCVPHFEGPAVFARLLDRRIGGAFSYTVADAAPPTRRYLPDTLVLESRWATAEAEVVGRDLLAVAPGDPDRPIRPGAVLVRRLRVTRGTARLTVEVTARPEYGTRAARWSGAGRSWRCADPPLWIESDLPLRDDGERLAGTVTATAGTTVTVLLGYGDPPPSPPDAAHLEATTCRTWREWSARSDYAGLAADAVRHSALVLRGLSFDETGALLAAPTTSLPEEIGGVRNWDYRYVWHRDAALLLLALFRLGHAEEGRRYLEFLLGICAEAADGLAPLVGLRGGTTVERELAHLDGYAGSRPVRVGNEAAEQVQFDTYGHVLDAALAYQELTGALDGDQWRLLRHHVDGMAVRWREPDHGPWEVRGPRRHYVMGKVMTWVCLDRGIRLAESVGDRDAPVSAWRRAREALRAEVLDRGYDPRLGSFVLAYGSTELDAALLRIPLVGFLPGDDPRMVSTIDRIREHLEIAPGLLRRYRFDDGLPGEEGGFLLCSFELVSALVLAGRHAEARTVFDRLLSGVGELGLCPEERAADGTALGNYPQAFTHLALIEAALNLDAAGDALHDWVARSARQGLS